MMQWLLRKKFNTFFLNHVLTCSGPAYFSLCCVYVFSLFFHVLAFVVGDVAMTLLLLFQRAYKGWGA